MRARFFILFALILLSGIAEASNATIAYRSATGSCAADVLNCPKIRDWNSSGAGSWGSEFELATSGSPVREAVIKYSPLSKRRIIVTQSDDGFLDAYVCNSNCGVASSWIVSNNIGQVWSAAPGTHSRRFDVEFESSTADAIVVYAIQSTNASRDLAYKVLPSATSSFSSISEQYIDDSEAADVNYTWVALDRKPTSSEEIIVVGFDGTSSDVNAFVWNGSAWGNQRELTLLGLGTAGSESLAVKYAADGTKGMVIAGDSSVAGNVSGAYWNGTAWTAANPGSINSSVGDANWMTLKADPATDDLQATFVTSLGALTTSYWNGSAWTILPSVIDALIDTSATRAADFEWDPSGSTGRVVWDDDGAGTTLTERPCAPECNGTTTTISTYNGAGAWIAMYRNPTAVDTVNILASRLNSDFDIGSFTWNGTGYTNYGDSAITANTTVITFEASTMSFQLSNASVNVHSCSLIDGNGEYVLTANLIGAPVSASPLSGSTCIKIASSNVTFDCNGFNITNNGTAGATYGILLNGSLTNVTVKNCPAISNYTYGIYANHTDNSLFTNNTLHSNSGGGGFVLVGGANNTINNSTAYNNSGSGGFVKNFGTGGNNSFINNNAYNNTQGFRTILADIDYINNTAYNNSQHGFDIGNVDFILLDNNTAYNNSQYGFNLVGSNNNATNNTAYNNTIYGFYVEGAHNRLIKNLAYRNLDNGIFVSAFVESNNTLYNNTAHSNTGDGFEVNLDDSNNLTLNVAYNNSLYGFNLNDTDNNTLEDNTAYNNSLDGFLFTSSSNNTLTNNTAYNNSKSGFLLKSNSNNTLTRNKAETNTQHGFLLNVSSGNTIISSNGTRNTLDGIRLLASNNNTIDPSFFCNNTGNGITVNNSNNTLIDDSVACNNTANGIEIINSTNTTINRSQIYNNSQGIFMTNSDSNNFTNSNVTNNTNNGIRFDSASTGSNLTTCRICNNALDINNLGTTNNGTADRCDSFVSWTENGHPGCTFTCSSFWHRFFGNVNGTLILGHNQSAPYVYSWNATGFNIYFTDADAVINFHQLQAIGRNTTNQTSTNDFTELDTAFNGTGFSDNINRTYSTDGSSPIETDNYTVFLRPINFVPVANSTAFNTSFNTGILWDMADGGTEYSNSFNQSTVWVVKINVSSADVYGTYDYLIQVPYTLATYEGNTSLVDIYLELK